ncbi:flavodoxin domain-containing protein [Oricola nitratireducens]|uniref:flavodoxin domain-containing protein n=1 Tax=Oricola nitratireducens TaxID=2775868 RepID=UPI0018689F73|nr:flavodoxin domain-containing protein [Oricola nitratireducens]
MRILIAYATIEGQTRKIVQHMRSLLEDDGHSIQLADAISGDDVPKADDFDAVIIAAPVHVGAFPAPLRRFVKAHAETLMARPGAFVSVSLSAASSDKSEVEEIADIVEKFSKETGWWPVSIHHAAGALKYTEYDFFRRWMLKRIAEKEGGPVDTSLDHEFTDWVALDAFVRTFVKEAPGVAGKI